MNNTENKNEKRKNTRFFFLFICLGGLLGFVSGFGVNLANFFWADGIKQFGRILYRISPVLFGAVCLLSLSISLAFLLRGKKIIQGWDAEDEAVYHRFDLALGRSMAASCIGVILSLTFFGLTSLASVHNEISLPAFLSCAVGLILINILFPFIQRQCVDLVKAWNPEKKGDALELHFQKKWLESCDEQERAAVYRASYKGFTLLSYTALVIFVLLFLLVFHYDIGFLPFLITGSMWLIPTCVYLHETMTE